VTKWWSRPRIRDPFAAGGEINAARVAEAARAAE